MHSKKHAKNEEERIERRKASVLRHRQQPRVKQKMKAYKQTPEYRAYNSKTHKIKRLQHRIDILEAYGSKCVHCGETNFFFLTLDHINNDGYLDAQNIGRGCPLYEHLLKTNLNSNLQILCHNCNAIKELHRRAQLYDVNAILYQPSQRIRDNVFTVAKAKQMGAEKLLELIISIKIKPNKTE